MTKPTFLEELNQHIGKRILLTLKHKRTKPLCKLMSIEQDYIMVIPVNLNGYDLEGYIVIPINEIALFSTNEQTEEK